MTNYMLNNVFQIFFPLIMLIFAIIKEQTMRIFGLQASDAF